MNHPVHTELLSDIQLKRNNESTVGGEYVGGGYSLDKRENSYWGSQETAKY